MGYRDLQERRVQRALDERQKRMRRRMSWLLILYILVALVAAGFIFGRRDGRPTPVAAGNTISITFGFDRSPVTRSFTTSVSGTNASTGKAQDSLGVRLKTDLRKSGDSAEFPAAQVTLGVTRLADNLVSLAITANPWAPEVVDPGLYQGTVQIVGAGITGEVPIQVYLGDRDRYAAAIAMALLLAGSSLGLVVKWITERLTPKAAMMRRVNNLKRAIGYGRDGGNLPVAVRMQIDDLEDLIERQDYARVEEEFKKLDSQRLTLLEVSSRFDGLFDQLASQQALVDAHKASPGHDDLLVTGVLDAEYRRLLQLQAIPWPERDAEIAAEAVRCQKEFALAHNILFAFLSEPSGDLAQALSELQEGSFQEAHDRFLSFKEQVRAVATAEDSQGEGRRRAILMPTARTNDDPRRPDWAAHDPAPLSWLFQYARVIAAIASIVVVSLVGLKTEYLDNQSFDGSLASWLTLGLWGLVVELSGLSVLDVVGRLGGSAAGGQPARA